MATPISQLSGTFTSYASGNLLVVVDVTDTSMAASGTDKRVTVGSFLSNYSIVTNPGSTSITTLGTVTTGVWQATAIGPSYLTSMVAAGASHSAGIVPDPGSSVHSPYYVLGDDAAWHAQTSITNLGTVTTGVWQGTQVGQSYLGAITATGSTTARSLGDRFGEVYNAKDYGATGNGTTDDTAAIAATITAAPAGSTVYVPPGTYKITSGIVVSKTLRWVSYGANFVYSGAAGAKVFKFAGASGTSIQSGTIEGLHVKNSAMDWSGGTTGIWLENLYHWTAEALYVENFQYGLVVSGISYGIVYCDIRLQALINNRYNFWTNQNSTGWTNELIIRGGHWLIDMTTAQFFGQSGPAAHVTMDLTGGATWGLQPDHITFDECSFEGNTTVGTLVAANLGTCSNILFLSCRNESTGNPMTYELALDTGGLGTVGSQNVWVLGGTAYQTGSSGSFWTDPNGGLTGCIFQQSPNQVIGNAQFSSLSVSGNAIYGKSTYCPAMSLEQGGTLGSSNVSSVAIYTRDLTLGVYDAASPLVKIQDTTAATGGLLQLIKQSNTVFSVGTTFSTSLNTSLTGTTTLGTLTGILKGTSGLVSVASAGTDYLTPTGSGTGLSGVALLASANTFSINQVIAGSSNSVQLLIKANGTQTQHIQDWTNSTGGTIYCYVSSSGTLTANGTGFTSVGSGYNSFNSGDSASRFTINSSGLMTWGPGNAAVDVQLSRSAAGVLAVASSGTGAGVLKAPLAGPLASKTTTYTATTQDRIILCTASSGWALTLPAASSTPAGFELSIKKTDNNANAITVTPNGSDTIDGAANYALSSQYKYVRIVCDGSASWYILGSN